ncbi:TonB-dependent receptor [Aquabacterium humicola]|uniref:TonB-dependent receptor n=1 Tax=Aquabacterium humicola TaxID=3237377 RepID=UPI0025427B70|nr:TonB-dependent receptor [Rubrivivax pictus]
MNDRHWFGFPRTVISIAVAMAAATPVLAQNTTAAVGGRVTDAGGRPVAGAAVTIRHVESGSTNNVTTDAEGRYAVRGLRVGGPYTVTFTKDGQTDTRNDVYLALAETTTLDGAIGVGTATVVVTGQAQSARFGSSNMGSGTNIGARELNSLATISRSLQDFARTDPRVSQTDKERGEISIAGQNSRFNSVTVDGVNISDTFGLKANNLPTLKQPISLDAIQSVQINVSNYDVTQKGYVGGNINAVTKSGTNEVHGSVFHTYRDDDHLSGDRYNRTNDTFSGAPNFTETLRGFVLGGPIVKDKLFFFVGYEELLSSKAAPEFGPLGGAKTNVGITSSAIASAAQIAKSTYNLDFGSIEAPGKLKTTVKDTLLKLDWNINDDHRANVRYTKTDQIDPSLNNITPTALSFNTNWHDLNDVIETVVGQWFADWTPNFSTELKVSNRKYDSITINSVSMPQIGLNFTGALPPGTPSSVQSNRTLFAGTERSRHFNALKTKTNDAYLGATWTTGPHELKFGADIVENTIYNAFLQDVYGNYTFRCLDANPATNPNFTYRFNNGAALSCGNATAAQVEAALLENFQRGRVAQFQVQAPFSGKTIDDGVARWSITDTGLFAQDTWKVNKQLTLTGGVRIDITTTGDKPLYNAAAAAPMVAANVQTNTRQTGGFGLDNSVTLDGEKLVQPRFGFNYNLDTTDKRRQQVRGGIGLFQGAAATVWLSNPYSNTGIATRFIGCGGTFAPCVNTNDNGIFNPDPTKQPTSLPGAAPAANVDFIEKGLGQPSVWKMNLAYDAELPWGGLVAGAEWLHTDTKQGIYYRHLNLGAPTRTGPDGRDLFYGATGYDPACWDRNGNAVSTCSVRNRALNNASYANVLLASKTGKGSADSLTMSLSQPAAAGLGWQLAYTRARAKEVSPLTSSVSNSNWAARSSLNPNEEVAANSPYLVRDRVSASLTWSQAFIGKYKTSVGLFYEGRTGKPYSWTFDNDANGDGLAGNDLMYIPTAPGSGEVIFASGTFPSAAAAEAAFWDTVHRYPELTRSRGGVTKRNGSFSPFTNSFDLRVSQEVPGFMSGHKGVISFDILNLGNLLDRRWGRIDEVGFQSSGGQARSFVRYAGMRDGKYVYNVIPLEDLQTRQAKGESQWAVQVTLKYEF